VQKFNDLPSAYKVYVDNVDVPFGLSPGDTPYMTTQNETDLLCFIETLTDGYVQGVTPQDPNFGSLFDLFSVTFREPWVVQRFLPAVVKGDKRIVLIDGIAAGAVNRVPAENDIRSNMVRGGAAAVTEFTPREREICETIGPELKRRGLMLVGIDVIDGFLTEINVTSPTGIRAIKKIGGPDLAVTFWDAVEAKKRG